MNLNDIDPLPILANEDIFGRRLLPHSKRQEEEWSQAIQKADGDDWRPVKDRPHLYQNGRGQFKYEPPEPPKEADIPIPCVTDLSVGDWIRYDGEEFQVVGFTDLGRPLVDMPKWLHHGPQLVIHYERVPQTQAAPA